MAGDETLIVGMYDGELISAVHVCFDIQGENLIVLAVATHVDWRGRGVAKVALEKALDLLDQTRIENGLTCYTLARIHPENEPSQKLFESFGFHNLGEAEGPGLQIWIQ